MSMKLNFGTFANILLICCAKPTTKVKFINTLVQSVDNTCTLSSNAISLLLNCTSNLPNKRRNGLGNIISNAENADPKAVATYFLKKVVPLIDSTMRKSAVIAMCELINKDDSIHANTIVDMVNHISKKTLRKQNRIVLHDFLAGVFLYVTTIDNRAGKETAALITTNFVQSSSMSIKRSIVKEPTQTMDAIQVYLSNAMEKYNKIKTLLYRDTPKPFYSFYIPNRIEEPSGRFTCTAIHNFNVKKIEKKSKYIILSGVGGLGKSMMMRHLMLNAIIEYQHFGHVPVLIQLKDYDGTNLGEFLYSKIKILAPHFSKELFIELISEGSFIFLLDGLDEINSNVYNKFEQELSELTDSYNENYYIISSRPYQSYVSLSYFTILSILPFTRQQSIKLIEQLQFRDDEPEFKKKFCSQIEGQLYATHRSFIENPLLLTIMLMTFEKFANIPTKMHIFYRKAYITLSEAHDATKGGFRRVFKSGLMPESISDYFAEFCFHSYKDEKFEFTEHEFAQYYNSISISNNSVKPTDFVYDLCNNLCLMFSEGFKYQFTHRSFQEYFCALFFSKQKDRFIKMLGKFFTDRQNRGRSDQVFTMLYDMIPDKVETNIFIPYLQDLFDECDNANGYWTFLQKNYPQITYQKGELNGYSSNPAESFLFEFITGNAKYSLTADDLPMHSNFITKEYGFIWIDENTRDIVDIKTIPKEYPWINEKITPVGWSCTFSTTEVLNNHKYEDIRNMLDDNNFIFKSKYNAARGFLNEIKERQEKRDFYFESLI